MVCIIWEKEYSMKMKPGVKANLEYAVLYI